MSVFLPNVVEKIFCIYFSRYFVPWALHGLLDINDIYELFMVAKTLFRVFTLQFKLNRAWRLLIFGNTLLIFEGFNK